MQSEISTTAAYDRRAFQNVILEELPQEHSALLIACLELFADVAAHDAQNAMPGELQSHTDDQLYSDAETCHWKVCTCVDF